MTHTVVGFFEGRSDAQAAMNDLIAEGFIKENIDISNRRFAGDATSDNYSETGTTGNGGEGIGDRIANFFNSLFGDDETTASNYTNAASDAEAILTVQADSDERARLAQEIMDRHDAIDVDERAAQYSQGYDATAGAATGGNVSNEAHAKIPVVKENLNVGKQQVERGGARIRSRVVERPVEETVRLREEHVVVDRRPVDREVTEADVKNFQPGEMEITEHAEVPVVGKEARVVEEVEVGKNVTEREEKIRDTEKATDVQVEDIDRDIDTAANTKANRAKP